MLRVMMEAPLLMSMRHDGALHLIHVVLGQMLKHVANVNVLFNGRSVESHTAVFGESVDLFAAIRKT